jgi:hypothetical protein
MPFSLNQCLILNGTDFAGHSKIGLPDLLCQWIVSVAPVLKGRNHSCRSNPHFPSFGRVTGNPSPTLFSAFPESLTGTGKGWGRVADEPAETEISERFDHAKLASSRVYGSLL